MRALLDTCVVIDFLQHRTPFCVDSNSIFLAAANHHFSAFVTAKSLTDIYYLTHKYCHNNKQTCKILLDLLIIINVLDTTKMDCQMALLSDISDYEDAVMVETALRTDMDIIITRNEKDYAKSCVPVCTPAQFLSMLDAD